MTIELDGEKLREICKQAEAFAKEHVVEACVEMLEWSDTSILRQGRVRELSAICRPMAGSDALRVAESYVKNAALEFVVQHGKTNE